VEIVWILVGAAVSFLVGFAGSYVQALLLRRDVRELQYGLADLEDRLIREVKKRASAVRWDAPPEPEGVKEELRSGFLHPAEFARRKSMRRMARGPEAGQVAEEGR